MSWYYGQVGLCRDLKAIECEEEKVHYCEPEQGAFLGEDDERRLIESLMDPEESSNQCGDLRSEISNEAREPCPFKFDKLYMEVGYTHDEGRKSCVVVIVIKGHEGILSQSIGGGKNLKSMFPRNVGSGMGTWTGVGMGESLFETSYVGSSGYIITHMLYII